MIREDYDSIQLVCPYCNMFAVKTTIKDFECEKKQSSFRKCEYMRSTCEFCEKDVNIELGFMAKKVTRAQGQ